MTRLTNESESDGSRAPLRETAIEIVRDLVGAGHEAYFAGGCVRDKLMGIAPADYDIATDAKPDDVARIFSRVQPVGESFGVMLVRKESQVVQVATFRTDGVYSDSRRPDSVTFSDAEHDAQRRDFTINGLFEDPLNDRIIDFVGGRDDLDARIIRAIGDAHARLREDRLRMLRAVRFAARFGFSIEADTAAAIRESAGELSGVSRERIGQEVKRMLSDPNRAVAAWELQYLGLDEAVLQEPHQSVAPTRLGKLPDDSSISTGLAAWIVDRHDDAVDQWIAIAHQWSDALVLSNEERFFVRRALQIYQVLLSEWGHIGVARQKRLASSQEFDSGLQLLQATDRQLFVDIRRRVIELAETGLEPAPFIDGSDLIALGISPGPVFTHVLESVYDAQLEGSIREKSEAIEMAKTIATNS